jgi:hypothetical protein
MKNKKTKLIIILAIPVFILTGFCFWWTTYLNNNLKTESALIIPVDYNSVLFYEAVSKFPIASQVENKNVVGLIAPHHDLAANYTAELFQKIGKRNIKTVIVAGPNHTNSGAGNIITGLVTYNCLNNQINPDTELVTKLIQDKIADSDISRLSTEHSIYNVMPYINYYFPEAKIVPIILSGRVTETQAKQLGEYLANYLNDGTIIIGSVDFSHYLTTEQANTNDIVSRAAVLNRDYTKLYSLNNDYLDSPATVVTVLTATEKVEANEVSIVRQANMADAIGSGSVPSSTSYFTVLLYK